MNLWYRYFKSCVSILTTDEDIIKENFEMHSREK